MQTPTDRIIARFRDISTIPRCSKNEDRIRQWLIQWADGRQFSTRCDSAGNLLINAGASPGYRQAPIIVIQGHLDMVCEKTPDSPHDFSRDPIQIETDGQWLKARGTTLGADNGIAVALAMALVEDETVGHPELELLFTVDEESGLNGAKKIAPDFIGGTTLLNLDSETEGEFTIGCAGGQDTHISCKIEFSPLDESFQVATLSVSGLRGGHSGIDIHKGRANANKVLARVLYQLTDEFTLRILSIQGGTAHNAIARDASAAVACPPSQLKELMRQVTRIEQVLKSEHKTVEPELTLSLDEGKVKRAANRAFTPQAAAACLRMLVALPHGPIAMSTEMADLVETSVNLATIKTTANTVDVLTSQRSSVASRLTEISTRIEALAALAGAHADHQNSYPPWQPDTESGLRRRCEALYPQIFGTEPKVTAIHAGLECAIIGDLYPGMQMISFGPTIENPHSPDERLHIPSIGRVWDFLTALLASYKDQ